MQERILQKAADLFLQYGIRSITMDEIALQLGISKKTIYQFYADKNELVGAVIIKILEHNRDCCHKYKAVAKDAVHEVFLAMEMVQELFENMNPSMLYDLDKYHPLAFEKFIHYKNNFLHRTIKENLEWGIKDELYRHDISVNITTLIRLESIMLPFSRNIFSRPRFKMAEVQQQLIEQFLFGVASLKGYKLILKYKEERNKKISQDENEKIK
ncbi:MAG: TetR/AcrR family transcriptional regulator [Chitinophagaceae bacterium]